MATPSVPLRNMDPSMVDKILRLLTELREDIRKSVSVFESIAESSVIVTTNIAAASPVSVSSDNNIDQLVEELDQHECFHVNAATTLMPPPPVSVLDLPVNAAVTTTPFLPPLYSPIPPSSHLDPGVTTQGLISTASSRQAVVSS
jgi:hypothetical protein